MKIGFCCKWVEETSLAINNVESHNQKTTTVTYMRKLKKDEAYKKIHSILVHNFQSLFNVFNELKKLRGKNWQ